MAQSDVFISQSECLFNEVEYRSKNLPSAISLRHDTLAIRIAMKSTCCATYKAAYSHSGKEIKIIYRNAGKQCYCRCLTEMEFTIPHYKGDIPSYVYLNKKKITISNDLFDVFTSQTDTLPNGNVVESHFKNNLLIQEVEHQDSIRILRAFRMGELQSEEVIKLTLTSIED